VRAGVAGAAAALVAVQVGLILGAREAGFAASTVLELQLFMLVLAVGALFLGMAVSERARIQTELLSREVELRDKQLDLERALRHAAASELASALAHELNQPLSAIGSYLRACELMLAEPEANRARIAETMGRAVAEARRAGEVVKGLREFFRTGTAQLERTEVRPLIEHALEGLHASLQRHDIDLRIICDAGTPRVHVDRVPSETVLQNLAGNAIDAMAADGRAERRLEIEAARDEARQVRVTVRDTGTGIDPSEAEQVFQPFHSTKPHGMGLGLALSRSIIESHGGRLWSEPRAGGATFRFTLPAEDRQGGAR
jgi:signal transduction histidine kinase